MKVNSITDKQILDFLKSKRKELSGELERVELAINALGGSKDPSPSEKTESPSKNKLTNKNKGKSQKKLEPQNEYNINDKLDPKISYALTQLEKGDKLQILNVIKEKEPDVELKKLERALPVRLSYLLNNDMIKGHKVGRSYIYRLY